MGPGLNEPDYCDVAITEQGSAKWRSWGTQPSYDCLGSSLLTQQLTKVQRLDEANAETSPHHFPRLPRDIFAEERAIWSSGDQKHETTCSSKRSIVPMEAPMKVANKLMSSERTQMASGRRRDNENVSKENFLQSRHGAHQAEPVTPPNRMKKHKQHGTPTPISHISPPRLGNGGRSADIFSTPNSKLQASGNLSDLRLSVFFPPSSPARPVECPPHLPSVLKAEESQSKSVFSHHFDSLTLASSKESRARPCFGICQIF